MIFFAFYTSVSAVIDFIDFIFGLVHKIQTFSENFGWRRTMSIFYWNTNTNLILVACGCVSQLFSMSLFFSLVNRLEWKSFGWKLSGCLRIHILSLWNKWTKWNCEGVIHIMTKTFSDATEDNGKILVLDIEYSRLVVLAESLRLFPNKALTIESRYSAFESSKSTSDYHSCLMRSFKHIPYIEHWTSITTFTFAPFVKL